MRSLGVKSLFGTNGGFKGENFVVSVTVEFCENWIDVPQQLTTFMVHLMVHPGDLKYVVGRSTALLRDIYCVT